MKTTQMNQKTILLLPLVALFALSTCSVTLAADTTPLSEDHQVTVDTEAVDNLLREAGDDDGGSKTPTRVQNPHSASFIPERYRTDHCFICTKYQKFQEIRPAYRYPGSVFGFVAFVAACWWVVDKVTSYYKHWKYCRWLDREGWKDGMPQASWSWTDPTSWFKS